MGQVGERDGIVGGEKVLDEEIRGCINNDSKPTEVRREREWSG